MFNIEGIGKLSYLEIPSKRTISINKGQKINFEKTKKEKDLWTYWYSQGGTIFGKQQRHLLYDSMQISTLDGKSSPVTKLVTGGVYEIKELPDRLVLILKMQ